MIRVLVVIAILLGVGVAILGSYLAPDDIAKCGGAPSEIAGCEPADAIVAVSGGNTQVRTSEAIRLYKSGWGKYLIFSGAAKDTTGPSNAEVMKTQALEAGVPSDSIIVDSFSQTTHQNAEETKAFINTYDISKLIVVTSPYHQRRAGLEFHYIMGDSVTIRNHPAPNDPDWPGYWWLTPRGWWLAGGELVKVGATHAGESQ